MSDHATVRFQFDRRDVEPVSAESPRGKPLILLGSLHVSRTVRKAPTPAPFTPKSLTTRC